MPYKARMLLFWGMFSFMLPVSSVQIGLDTQVTPSVLTTAPPLSTVTQPHLSIPRIFEVPREAIQTISVSESLPSMPEALPATTSVELALPEAVPPAGAQSSPSIYIWICQI